MTFLLREVLLGALGIESDLNWGTDEKGISAIDLDLLPAGSGALISKITELGKVLKRLENITEEQNDNPYRQSICDSVDNYLDSYRSTILTADQEICSKLLTTLTGLVARLEPYQHELLYVDKYLNSLLSSKPLEMLNKIHEIVVAAPKPIDEKLSVIEHSLHQVAISQLDGFIFYHQKLPEIFDFDNGRIVFSQGQSAKFIDSRLANLLLLIVNVKSDCTDLFDKTDPPNFSDLQLWINAVSQVTSALLSQRLQQAWPSYYMILSSILFIGRSDLISTLARRLLNPHTTSYNVSAVISTFNLPLKVVPDYRKEGLTLKCVLQPPLDMVVTPEYQDIIGKMSRFFFTLAKMEEALKRMWLVSRKMPMSYRYVSLLQMLVKTIKDYTVFSIITPAIVKLDPTGEKITDYLKFKVEFGNFIGMLVATLPYHNSDLSKASNKLSSLIVGTWSIVKSQGNQINDRLLIQQLLSITDDVEEAARTIVDVLDIKTEESIELRAMTERIFESLEQCQ